MRIALWVKPINTQQGPNKDVVLVTEFQCGFPEDSLEGSQKKKATWNLESSTKDKSDKICCSTTKNVTETEALENSNNFNDFYVWWC